jgi:tetratricopeptide (TPR) repeat protein
MSDAAGPEEISNSLELLTRDESDAAARARSRELVINLESAVAHHQAGNLKEAEALYTKLLDAAPRHPGVSRLLGVVKTRLGQAESGVELITRAFPVLGRVPGAHVDLGNALRLAGKREEAIESYRRAIALRPDYALAHNCLAGVLGELGRFEAAITHCQTAIAIDPKWLPARMTLAAVLQGARRLPEAAQAWREIIALRPDRPESYHQLAAQLVALGLFKEAIYCNDRAIALQPDNAGLHCAQGHTLLRQYDGERAAVSFRQALALSPRLKEGWAGLSWALRLLGRFDEADACLDRLREIDPTDLREIWHIPSTGQQTQSEGQIERLAAVIDRQESTIENRIMAGFALGRLLDTAGRFDEAFLRYTEANAFVRKNWPRHGDSFDARVFTRQVDGMIAANTVESLTEAAVRGNMSELPIFIVGMPRSGTTLVEQICASHSRIFGAGELDDIARIAAVLPPGEDDRSIRAEAGRRAADAHIVKLYRLGLGALRVVDKLPDNVLFVGLIARLFPRARIVYCSRDPRDISLSCYFQLFSDGAQFFSYDLADCGTRCWEVYRLAAHWLKLLPFHMIEVNYEKLIADLEGESRRLIEFLGLDWEPACLDFHRTERTVATVSHWQVRQPLYASSVGRWRHYEKHLGPLFSALDRA